MSSPSRFLRVLARPSEPGSLTARVQVEQAPGCDNYGRRHGANISDALFSLPCSQLCLVRYLTRSGVKGQTSARSEREQERETNVSTKLACAFMQDGNEPGPNSKRVNKVLHVF